MEEAMEGRYWCHMCSQMVNPIMEVEIKCPFCLGGFIEEMSGSRSNNDADSDFASERALSLWAPILLGMIGNRNRRNSRFRRLEFDEDDDEEDDNNGTGGIQNRHTNETSELDRELESIIRRRRRSSATILQMLEGIRAGIASESENSEGDRDRDREREREQLILINPFNQTIIVHGSQNGTNQNPLGSLGDYFIGPGLDLLLQHLAENDPNRYGTPPAQKEAVEALPSVKINENLQCAVCLDDFEIGTQAKEMPCKHKFHDGCILPWLELHSSCPICRFQLASDETKRDLDNGLNRNLIRNQREENENIGHVSGDTTTTTSGRSFSFPWPFSGLFSSSSSSSSGGGNGNGNSSSNPSNSAGNASGFQSNT